MSIRRTHRPDKTWPEYQLQLRVNQTKYFPLFILSGLFGGRVVEYSDKWGTAFRWTLTGTRAAAALERVRPYLMLKDVHADVALRFMSRRPSRRPDREADEEDFAALATLNERRTREPVAV